MSWIVDISDQVFELHDYWRQAPPRWAARLDDVMAGGPWCLLCGCTDSAACNPPCSWAGQATDEHGEPLGWICSSPACLEKAGSQIAPELFWPGVEPWPRQHPLSLDLPALN